MRLLFITETIPFPLDSGGRIKTYHTLCSLARGHEVHCHAFIRDPEQRRHTPELERVCASLTLHLRPRSWAREAGALGRSLANGVPLTVARHVDRGVLGSLQRACREQLFDAVYCDHLSMLEYARHLPLPAIHDAHNVEFELIRRYASTLGSSPARLLAGREWRLVKAYERQRYAACHLVLAVSERDARGIRELAGPTVDVRVLPISVDAQGTATLGARPPRPALLYVGGLHWPPNADAVRYFIDEIWPLILRDTPGATLTVVGRDDAPVASALRQTAGVHLAGYVDDVSPYFEQARALVVPLRAGGGMRVKILETLARGLPVVSTSIGYEGIDAVPGVHLLAADSPSDFARETLRVFRDDALVAALARAGRELALRRYDREVVGADLRRVIAEFGAALAAQRV
jgi:glycosyltransferase involved in cell wall biosynthesis